MITPDPPDPPERDPTTILTALTEAFTKLPPLLSFGGLILVAGVVLAAFTGIVSDLLLAIPAVVIVAFLVYAFLTNRHEMDKARLEAQREADARQHEREMRQVEADLERFKIEQEGERAREQRDSERGELPAEEAEAESTATEVDESAISPAEWQRRYMAYLVQLCGYPPYTALIDIREAGIKVTRIALERIYTSLDVPASAHLRRPPAEITTAPDRSEVAYREAEQREPVLAAISRPENRRLVILGAPGSGKSTLVNYLTLCLAGDHLKRADINQSLLHEQGWALATSI